MRLPPEGNPRIPEGINTSEEHPLKEFFLLLVGVTSSIVFVVVVLSVFARVLAPHIPFEWETTLTPAVMEYVGQSTVESGSPERELALQKLSQSLLNSSMEITLEDGSEESTVPPEAFQFHLMEAGGPNAFATLGGHIVITDALLEEIISENGLAMVIAHEIAHIQLRHPIEAAGRGIVIQLLLSAVLGSSGTGFLYSTSTFTLLGFNREMETTADERALLILRQHYGHMGGADEFFAAMEKDTALEKWLEFTHTHPNTERRLEHIRKAMAQNTAPPILTPLPQDLRQLEYEAYDLY